MLAQAVYELCTVRPHDTPGLRLTPPEYRAYSQGYDRAIVMSLKVMDLAYDRWKHRRDARRKAGRTPASKTGAA